MASPAAERGGSDPPPDGSARPHASGPGADPGHGEPRERSPAGQEGIEHGDGAAAARSIPRAGRRAPSATAENICKASGETSRSLTGSICIGGGLERLDSRLRGNERRRLNLAETDLM